MDNGAMTAGLSELIDTVQDYAVFALDETGRITSWNKGAEKMTGHRAAAVMGRGFSCLYPPKSIAAGIPQRDLETAQAKGHHEEEARRVRRDGTEFWALASISKGPGGYVVILRDVTARKSGEETLRRDELRFRSLIKALSEIVWTATALGTPGQELNLWEEVTGQSKAETAGFGWLDAVHPDDQAMAAAVWTTCVATRQPLNHEFRMRRADGEWRNVVARGAPVMDDGGRVLEWVGICMDVTERRRAEAELEELKQRQFETPEAAGSG
jgi:PAS domain S-box-containing protein